MDILFSIACKFKSFINGELPTIKHGNPGKIPLKNEHFFDQVFLDPIPDFIIIAL
jgi:hypothetical protein